MTGGSGKRDLPGNPHIEHLRKEAKQRLGVLKLRASGTRLADAQHLLASEYGFANWRGLKEEVTRRMGLVRMAPVSPHHARRFHRPVETAEEELEADGFFVRGAAAMQIGVIAALVVAGYVMLMLFARDAFGQTAPSEAARAEQAQPRTAISFDPAQFDKYAGSYQMGPRTVLTLRRDGGRFFAQAGGQPAVEIFPESPTKFFLKAVPAQISFMPDAQGAVTGLTLHQGGREIAMPRIDEAQAKAIAALPRGHPIPRTWPLMATAAPRFLTALGSGSADYWPCFSPDGRTVLFSRTASNGREWSFYRVSAAGGEAERIALPVSATRASWRGNQIAFTAEGGGRSSLWIMQADGSGARQVAADLVYPSWYPDGTLAATDTKTQAIRRMNAQGGDAVPLTDRAVVLAGMASVSPDGNRIAFAGQKNGGQVYDQSENVIWLMDGRGGDARTLETPPLQGRAPVWSPDGKRLAFESDRGSPEGHYAVFLINADGSGLMQVTDYALDATHPVFSPDGRQMVFAYGTPAGKNGIAIVDLP
ncbi:MAG TPA: DUF3471 domain-containing protein [Rhizomicrobium sp.]|nr:DUF3471 domain-containing protein [Rhizomicrobium sp.]